MASAQPTPSVGFTRAVLVPLAFLVTSSLLLPVHHRHQPLAQASGLQADGDPGPGEYLGRRGELGPEETGGERGGTKGRAEDLPKKSDGAEGGRNDGAGYAEQGGEASVSNKLEGVVDTEALDVTAVPVISWPRRRVLGDTHRLPTTHEESNEPVMTIEFRTEQLHLVLDLRPTRDLLAASYTEPEKDGRPAACEYQGEVRGVAGSWAALSVCDAVRGVVSVGSGGQELLVEPAAEGASTLGEPHRVFSASLLRDSPGTCGVMEAVRNQSSDGQDLVGSGGGSSRRGDRRGLWDISPRGRREAPRQGGRLWTLPTTRFVELVLVADSSYFGKYGSGTRGRCRAIVNIVNALYRPLGVVVVLTHLEVWKGRDQVVVSHDHRDTLDNLRPYRKRLLKERPHDNTVLITEVDFIGSTVGYASVSGMCGEKESVAVVQDKNEEVGVVSQTLAHEMGHNLGMHHDVEGECSCSSHNCIMSDTGSSHYEPSTGWSSCSRRDLVVGIDSPSFGCLKNVPTELLSGSSCGDGVVDVEAGEQCDCGPPEYCDNSCCVADSCRLAANASCASGACCDAQTCRVEPGGTECRAARNSCDLPEYCTGEDEFCPGDVFRSDGAYCRGEEGRCYRGKCSSHEMRCREIWGHDATTASRRCFQRINRKGGSDGNCGFVSQEKTGLLPCAVRDTLCGTLQCWRRLSAKPQLVGQFSYQSQFFGNDSCSYIQATTYVPSSFWLSPEGAACGGGRMCVKQRCVEVPAPEGDCLGGCSGRGVCNSKGHCHCDAGFAPPDCSRRGLGGSVDSGPRGRPRTVHVLFDVLFFSLLVLFGVFLVVFCLWDQIRNWWELGGRASASPRCAACLDASCCPAMTKLTRWVLTDPEGNAGDEARREEGERDRILCRSDAKDGPLLTEVRAAPPKPPVPGSKPGEAGRPAYLQSVSADSGCVVDDFSEGVCAPEGHEPRPSRVSMTSLAGFFRTFEPRSSRKEAPGSRRSRRSRKTPESQRPVPLSRFVVDPLAGKRSSRQGTPPPDHKRAAFRRSVTVDASCSGAGSALRPTRAPPPPPPAEPKPCRSESNLHSISELEKSPRVHARSGSSSPASRPTKPPPKPLSRPEAPPQMPKLKQTLSLRSPQTATGARAFSASRTPSAKKNVRDVTQKFEAK